HVVLLLERRTSAPETETPRAYPKAARFLVIAPEVDREVLLEPRGRFGDHLIERSRLLEQMSRVRNDMELGGHDDLPERAAIDLDELGVIAADHEQRRRPQVT